MGLSCLCQSGGRRRIVVLVLIECENQSLPSSWWCPFDGSYLLRVQSFSL